MNGTNGSICELRHYTANPGRGEAMINRFLTDTLSILGRLDVEVIGTWLVEDEPDQMVYMVRWPNREHMTQMWKTFFEDPQWKAVKERTETNGRLVASIVSTVIIPASRRTPAG
jgi:NIPSNAP